MSCNNKNSASDKYNWVNVNKTGKHIEFRSARLAVDISLVKHPRHNQILSIKLTRFTPQERRQQRPRRRRSCGLLGAMLEARAIAADTDAKLSVDALVGNQIADFTPALFAASRGHCRKQRRVVFEDTAGDEANNSSETAFVEQQQEQRLSSPRRSFANADGLIRLTVEGEFFNFGSLATINRKVVLLFMRHSHRYHVRIKSYQSVLASRFVCLETLIIFSMYMKQKKEQNNGDDLIRRKVLFRNRWKLSMRAAPRDTLLIEQQPLDYHAMPKVWLPYLNKHVDELWVPSEFNKRSYVANGLDADKIQVIAHGIFVEKFKRSAGDTPLRLSGLKKRARANFKFLNVGGLKHRKGVDKLVEAYAAAFTSADNVTLIIHSIYGDFTKVYRRIEHLQANKSAPDILVLKESLKEPDMVRLYHLADAYVSPYRSEGFGLTILEAMAAGAAPIISNYGPALEFCSPECGYLVDAVETECRVDVCGNMMVLGYKTAVQALWSEPSVESLTEKLRDAYNDRAKLARKVSACQRDADKFTWSIALEKMRQRVEALVEKRFG